jgi:CRP-like cAMP-binding protein
MKVRVL